MFFYSLLFNEETQVYKIIIKTNIVATVCQTWSLIDLCLILKEINFFLSMDNYFDKKPAAKQLAGLFKLICAFWSPLPLVLGMPCHDPAMTVEATTNRIYLSWFLLDIAISSFNLPIAKPSGTLAPFLMLLTIQSVIIMLLQFPVYSAIVLVSYAFFQIVFSDCSSGCFGFSSACFL